MNKVQEALAVFLERLETIEDEKVREIVRDSFKLNKTYKDFMEELIHKIPNDQQLGEVVRLMFRKT